MTRYCVVCGKPLIKNQNKYCSKECCYKIRKEKAKLRYQEQIKPDKEQLQAMSQRALERYYKTRHERTIECAKQILKISDVEELATYIDRNFRLKHDS